MKNTLIDMAKEIKQIDQACIEEYTNLRNDLVSKINSIMTNRSDINDLIGENNIDMMKDNHANHARFVQSILSNYNPEILVDTVGWVYRAYRSRGFHSTYWAAQINAWITILKESLSQETFQAIYPLYNWFSITIPHFTNMSDQELSNYHIPDEQHE